jgi:hypothetical protein
LIRRIRENPRLLLSQSLRIFGQPLRTFTPCGG